MQRSLWTFALALTACSRAPAPAPAPAAPPAAVSQVIPVPAQTVSVASFVALKTPANCAESPGIQLFAGPRAPRTGRPLRVLAYAEKPLAGALVLHDPSGAAVASSQERHGGPPYWW